MLLAIDTATYRASVALHDGRVLRGECTWESRNRHTVTLIPRIVGLLSDQGIDARDLTAIGICLGPGSYTGVRIGVSVAKGLASARKLPLIGVTTLDVLVAAYPRDPRPLLAIFAAGRSRVGYARYRWKDGRWQAQTGVQVASWSEMVGAITSPSIVLGEIQDDGWDALRALYDKVEVPPPAWHLRRAGYLADIAWQRLRANQIDAPSALLPLYAR